MRLSRLLVVLAFLPLLAAAAEPEAVFQLEPYRKTIAIRAKVGGVEAKFALDTAAGLTVLDEGFARQIGCRQRQRITGFQMTGTRLDSAYCEDVPVDLGGGRYKAVAGTAAVADMNKLYGT